jgi:hypothetical protein
MGRTGRKREGKIAILLTEGKEEASYLQSLKKKNNIYKIISNSQKHFQFYKQNPLMIPKHIKIKCHKMFIKVPDEKDQTVNESKATTKKTTKKTKLKKEKDESIKNDETYNQTMNNNKIESLLRFASSQSSQLPNLDFDLENSSEQWTHNYDQTTNFDISSKPTSSKLSISNNKNDYNFFKNNIHCSLTSKSSISNASKQNLKVNAPVKVNTLLKISSLKGLSSLADEFSKVNLNECIQLWQTDEDDFRIIKDDFHNTSNNNDSINENKYSINESQNLLNKFADFYKKLLSDLDETTHLKLNSIENKQEINTTSIQKYDSFSKSKCFNDQNASTRDVSNTIYVTSNANDFFVNETFQTEKSYQAKLEPVKPQIKNPTLINIILDDQNNNKNEDEPRKDNITTTPSNISKKTSTPLRSILKNSNYLNTNLNNDLLSNESPLVVKPNPSQVGKQLDLGPKLNKTQFNESLVGMTQALECINKSLILCEDNLKDNLKNSKNHNESNINNNESVIVTFDMKSNLFDLFDGCILDDESNNEKSVLNISDLNHSNIVINMNTKSQMVREKNVSIRFDNSTIFETNNNKTEKTEVLIDSDQTDDSIVFKKVNYLFNLVIYFVLKIFL